jgi:Flp pilus assembly protein TadD
MSILDGMISTKQEMDEFVRMTSIIAEDTLERMQPTERTQSILDLMKEGLTLGDILGLKKPHRDALLTQGLQFIQLGELEKGREVLERMYQLDPFDERSLYGLATSYQLEGDFSRAGKLYVQFLALDATNPDGHARLGECFLGAGELENAESCFKTAKRLAAGGEGRPGVEAEADAMLSVVAERRAA